jgi:two-component system sensor histidine kinase RpfC
MILLAILSNRFSAFRDLYHSVKSRNENEIEQGVIRLIFITLLEIYLVVDVLFLKSDDTATNWNPMLLGFGYFIFSIALLSYVLKNPAHARSRVIFSMAFDIAATTYCMYLAGPAGSLLIIVYLWLMVGNGLRYGLVELYTCMVFSVTGFGLLVMYDPYWADHRSLGAGLLIGMIILPLFMTKMIRRLHMALKHAEDANLAKTRFVANISHELRTPLNGVVSVGHLLSGTHLDNKQKGYVRTIITSSRALLALIEQILNLSKIESGKQPVYPADLDLQSFLSEVCAILNIQARNKNIRLLQRISPACPSVIHTDPGILRQILINLVGNAIKFTEIGRIAVRVSPVLKNGRISRLRFEIDDTGVGIPESARSYIFDSFAQVDNTITRRHSGSGLGTSIAKQLTELLGGTIDFISTPGVGSCFWFEIPYTPVKGEKRPDTPITPKILIVGNREITKLVESAAKESGAEIVVMHSHTEGFMGLQNQAKAGNAYDAVIFAEDDLSPATLQTVGLVNRDAAFDQTTSILVTQRHPPDKDAWSDDNFTYIFTVPLNTHWFSQALMSTTAYRKVASDYPTTARKNRRQMRVLVAEDNETNRQVLKSLLEDAGHVVTLVDDGEQALEALNTQKPFNVAIVDLMMPKMGGLEVVATTRASANNEIRHLPFVVFTANATKEAMDECMEAGANAFVSKPVVPDALLDTIDQVTKGKPQLNDTRSVSEVLATSSGYQLNHSLLRALGSVGKNHSVLLSAIDSYSQDSRSRVRKIESALDQSSYDAYRREVHALKGAASAVGALQTQELCARLESVTAENLKEVGPGALGELRESVNQSHQALQEYRDGLKAMN